MVNWLSSKQWMWVQIPPAAIVSKLAIEGYVNFYLEKTVSNT